MQPYDRNNPFQARIQERVLLTKNGSTKKTYHLSLSLAGSELTYKPGDSIAILPVNDPHLVEQLLRTLNFSGEEEITDPRGTATYTLHDYLLHKANLQKTNTPFLRAIQERAPHSALAELLILENKPKLTAFLEQHIPAELLDLHPKALFSPQELVKFLLPLLPRFYSIASSQALFPEEVHLTVASVSYTVNGVVRHGVGTHFLCERAAIGSTPIPIYLQASHGFTLPAHDASIILIGPGTGVAPFRAFLQERLATQASGRNWLFFGERHRKTDFYYEDFWLELEKQGRLRLDLAFSRDTAQKTYVQHLMWQQRKDLWAWIEEGAYFYVCGDANEMAKDVEATLQQIAKEEGGLSDEEARRKVKSLRAEKRYLADVY